MAKIELHPDRFFDPDSQVRKIARELYEEHKNLPIISPHGHVDPKILAENTPFPDPVELLVIPDHYLFRLLYSQGIPLESLGIPTMDGTEVEKDHRKIWHLVAEHFYLFAGTPTGIWLDYEFKEVFGLDERPDGQNAQRLYDELSEKLSSPEFLPRALFERFNIEVLSTTDGATDALLWHKKIKESGWPSRVIPSFRPDALTRITRPEWMRHLHDLQKVTNRSIHSFKDFLDALRERRQYFKQLGATSTDHGVQSPFTQRLSPDKIEQLFQKALKGQADARDQAAFESHMLMEMAAMSLEDGLVMQIHPGSFRDHNQLIYKRFGPDKGADIPLQTEFTRNLHALLNEFGNEPDLTIIVFTLDETTYSRELAPLAGHYPALRLGPPWWFHDSLQGMLRFKKQVIETASIYNLVGFNDDTRAFTSIPARHDLSRRMDANFLARQVARHVISMDEASHMMRALTYELAKKAYKL
ncbi:MAG TPA: glucuronate isomerase [Caldithrix abyssi]|uniref:Uronate isomerase n=1 Tax=Caldithrix abyssi TaxID=187145 RepID=A0A7V5LJE0_CALAY|nr:glucuronate isomerase [Caldithrix abyssi]